MNDDEIQLPKTKVNTYLGDSREQIRTRLEVLLEDLPNGIEKAKAGDAESAAVYLSAIEKILCSALNDEAIAYKKLVSKQDK